MVLPWFRNCSMPRLPRIISARMIAASECPLRRKSVLSFRTETWDPIGSRRWISFSTSWTSFMISTRVIPSATAIEDLLVIWNLNWRAYEIYFTSSALHGIHCREFKQSYRFINMFFSGNWRQCHLCQRFWDPNNSFQLSTSDVYERLSFGGTANNVGYLPNGNRDGWSDLGVLFRLLHLLSDTYEMAA